MEREEFLRQFWRLLNEWTEARRMSDVDEEEACEKLEEHICSDVQKSPTT